MTKCCPVQQYLHVLRTQTSYVRVAGSIYFRFISSGGWVKTNVRLILVRSDSEFQIFTFRSEIIIGLLTQSDGEKPDGTKSNL